MIYKNIEEVYRDYDYLTQKTSFDYLISIKPNSSILEKYLSNLTRFDDKFILEFFKSLIKDLGLKVSNWKTEISAHKLPAIVFIPNEGLKICLEVTPENFFKLESSSGIEYFAKLPNGSKILEFTQIRCNDEKITASKMFKDIAFKQKKYIFFAIIASFSINIFALVTSLYSMQVYDRVIPTGAISTLISLSIGAVIAIFIEMVLKISRSLILEKANKNMDMEYSHQIFDRFLKIRCDALPKSIGLLSGQLQSYSSVRNFISSISLFLFIDLPFAIFFLSIIVMIGGFELGLVIFVFLIFSVLSGILYKNKLDSLTKTSTMSSYKKLALLVETVENAESVKSTYNGWKLQNKWNKLTNDNIEDDIKIKHFTDISSYVTTSIQQISYVILVGLGAYIVSSSTTITMGALIAVSILSNRVFSPFSSIPTLFISWGRAKLSVKDLNNIFELPSDNNGVKRSLNPEIVDASLACNNIRFQYNEDTSLLSIKSLKIAYGEKIGILGMIGSGKSTLLKILAGLYKVKEGIVTINGIDLQQISREKISKIIGYLPQNVKLLSGSLRENLTLGMIGIDDVQIIEACKQSGLIQLVNSLPKGLDTDIPDGSDSVSSGQRQLIGLTRLIILNPKIWLLDEPTANIDEMSEKLILNFFNNNILDRTLILISHKQSNFTIVNRLILMNQNSIILDGNKEDVISKLNQANFKNS
ncbi:MAG: ATP-binding cassette domain-containing protein [Candidatus Altimarinota bacterium]